MLSIRAPVQAPVSEGEVTEVGLLIPTQQAEALEAVAHRLGLTAGAVVRRLICDFLRAPPDLYRARSAQVDRP